MMKMGIVLQQNGVSQKHSLSFYAHSLENRSFSTSLLSREQLCSDIEFVVNDINKFALNHNDALFYISTYKLESIQKEITAGLYTLRALRRALIKGGDLLYFLLKTIHEIPDMGFNTSSDPDYFSVFLPADKEDCLVFMGLALSLFRLSRGSLPLSGFKTTNSEDFGDFFKKIEKMGKVRRVYKLNLSVSLDLIPIGLVLEKVKPFVGDGFLYKLISEFLNIPIHGLSSDRTQGIPLVGELTSVLFNIVLKDVFDREFSKRFPGIACCRLLHEVFLSTRKDSVRFDKYSIYGMLEELGLDGEIWSIGICDEPLPTFGSLQVFIESDGVVTLKASSDD
jgi:hypothetical protein